MACCTGAVAAIKEMGEHIKLAKEHIEKAVENNGKSQESAKDGKGKLDDLRNNGKEDDVKAARESLDKLYEVLGEVDTNLTDFGDEIRQTIDALPGGAGDKAREQCKDEPEEFTEDWDKHEKAVNSKKDDATSGDPDKQKVRDFLEACKDALENGGDKIDDLKKKLDDAAALVDEFKKSPQSIPKKKDEIVKLEVTIKTMNNLNSHAQKLATLVNDGIWACSDAIPAALA